MNSIPPCSAQGQGSVAEKDLGTITGPFPLWYSSGAEAQGVEDSWALSPEPLSSTLRSALAPLPLLWQTARHLQSPELDSAADRNPQGGEVPGLGLASWFLSCLSANASPKDM